MTDGDYMDYRRILHHSRQPKLDESPIVVTAYRRFDRIASNRKGGAAPYSTPILGDTQPNLRHGSKKLLERFRDKMRSLHYATTIYTYDLHARFAARCLRRAKSVGSLATAGIRRIDYFGDVPR